MFEIFSHSFFGFGRYRSPLWFIGPYTSFLTTDSTEIARRLEMWHRRGQPPTVDLSRFLAAIEDTRYGGERPKLHRVWSKLARMCLAYEGHNIDDNVRSYQATELGAFHSDSALVHVLPIESPSEGSWPFSDAERPHLRRPDLYGERFTVRRLRQISRNLARYRPRTVIFYDLTHRQWWEELAGGALQKTSLKDCCLRDTDSTLFMMVRHPESIGT
ncbi:MAG: hypothetical protein R3178_03930, partial [Rhodothermales bacterium]|nr:hypothetical protein [Rhodothermales bacterium]